MGLITSVEEVGEGIGEDDGIRSAIDDDSI